MPLLAIHAEIIVEYSGRAICIDRKMHGFMHEEVVPWPLADNPEVIYEGKVRQTILERTLKTLLRNANGLVLVPSGFAGTADALRLKMEEATDIVFIDRERE